MASSTTAASIALENVQRRYLGGSGALLALDDVSLQIPGGELVSIVGPSGCGKSTLLRIIAGLDEPTAGRVLVNGLEINGPRDDVGIVFQSAVLLPWRTVEQNVLLPIEVHRKANEHERARAKELLATMGLEGFERRMPHELSGGMQQRVGIARALLKDPALLLMDEPFGALDAMTREQLNLELQRIWLDAQKTVIFITHSIPEAVFLGDRVVVMGARPGTVLADLPVGFARPRNLGLINTEDFGAIVSEVRAHLAQRAGEAA